MLKKYLYHDFAPTFESCITPVQIVMRYWKITGLSLCNKVSQLVKLTRPINIDPSKPNKLNWNPQQYLKSNHLRSCVIVLCIDISNTVIKLAE